MTKFNHTSDSQTPNKKLCIIQYTLYNSMRFVLINDIWYVRTTYNK